MSSELNFSLRMLHLAGVPFPSPPKLTGAKLVMWWIYGTTIDFFYATFTISTTIELTNSFHDLGAFSACFFPVIVMWQVVFRHLCVWAQRKTIIKIIEETHQLASELDKGRQSRLSVRTKGLIPFVNKMTAIRLGSQLSLITCLGIFSFINSWTGKSTAIPSPAWVPFDKEQPVNNLILIIVEVLGVWSSLTKISSMELHIHTLIALPGLHCDELKKHLEYLMERSYKRMDNGRFDLLWWIKQHQLVLSIATRTRKVLSPILFFHYLLVLAEVMVALLAFTSPTEMEPFREVAATMAATVAFIQFYVFSVIGDYFGEKECSVAEDAYNTNMLFSDERTRRAFLMIKMRTQKETNLSAFGLYTLSSMTFAVLAKATFSVYVAIKQINERTKVG